MWWWITRRWKLKFAKQPMTMPGGHMEPLCKKLLTTLSLMSISPKWWACCGSACCMTTKRTGDVYIKYVVVTFFFALGFSGTITYRLRLIFGLLIYMWLHISIHIIAVGCSAENIHTNCHNALFQSLLLLNYLIKNGSERVVTSAREHLYDLRQLETYSFHEENGRDQGINSEWQSV